MSPLITFMIVQKVWRALFSLRLLTGSLRLLPDFVMLGTQRGGTTTLYRYLVRHPCVAPAFGQEVHFFDDNFHRGVRWYRAHFPLTLHKDYVRKVRRLTLISGEASGYYLVHPHALRRISKLIPHVKLIVLLRNPVDRAWAHYHQSINKGETLPFEEAIRTEEARLSGERGKMLADDTYVSRKYRRYSYLTRGIYVDQLKEVMSVFPEQQVLILKSEDLLFDNPAEVLRRTVAFLELPMWEPSRYTTYGRDYYPPMKARTRTWLVDFFNDYNRRLYEYLGVNFGWDS